MSRSPRKTHSRKTRKIMGMPVKALPWIIGVAAILLIVVVVLLAQSSAAAIDPNFTPKVKGAPSLEVAQPFFDLGNQHFNVTVNVTYNLQNVGDQPLRVLGVPKVQVLEGC